MTQRLSTEPPDAYLIEVQGNLTSWKGRLGELELHAGKDTSFGRVTTLAGPVRDQAELFGILNTIYELHLPLLRLQPLNDSEQDDETR